MLKFSAEPNLFSDNQDENACCHTLIDALQTLFRTTFRGVAVTRTAWGFALLLVLRYARP